MRSLDCTGGTATGVRRRGRKFLLRGNGSGKSSGAIGSTSSSRWAAMAPWPTLPPGYTVPMRPWQSFPPARRTSPPGHSASRPTQLPPSLLFVGSYRLRSIDVGRSDGRSFIHMAGAGFDAELFSRDKPALEAPPGLDCLYPRGGGRASVAAVRRPHHGRRRGSRGALFTGADCEWRLGHRSRVSRSILGSRSTTVGSTFIVFTPSTPPQIAATLGHAGKQQLDRSPHVMHTPCSKLWRIDAVPPLPVELDGDPRGNDATAVQHRPRGLQRGDAR